MDLNILRDLMLCIKNRMLWTDDVNYIFEKEVPHFLMSAMMTVMSKKSWDNRQVICRDIIEIVLIDIIYSLESKQLMSKEFKQIFTKDMYDIMYTHDSMYTDESM